MRKRSQPGKSIKTDAVVSQHNHIASDVWETDTPVRKLTTEQRQSVLFNVPIRAIYEH